MFDIGTLIALTFLVYTGCCLELNKSISSANDFQIGINNPGGSNNADRSVHKIQVTSAFDFNHSAQDSIRSEVVVFNLDSVSGEFVNTEPNNTLDDSSLLVKNGLKKDLYLLGLFPIEGNWGAWGKAFILASEMALDHINNRSDILQGYTLKLDWNDTKVQLLSLLSAAFLNT